MIKQIVIMFWLLLMSWMIWIIYKDNKEKSRKNKMKICDFDYQKDCRYFELTVNDMHKTYEGGNLWIGGIKPVKIKKLESGTIIRQQSIYPTCDILVPRRRERVFHECSKLTIGERYVFKLLKESRSEKFMVSEVFMAI